jgi:hypothetical protein
VSEKIADHEGVEPGLAAVGPDGVTQVVQPRVDGGEVRALECLATVSP